MGECRFFFEWKLENDHKYLFPEVQIRQNLAIFSDRVKQLLRFIPTKAGICDGFSVDVISTDLLIAWFDIALDHEPLYH